MIDNSICIIGVDPGKTTGWATYQNGRFHADELPHMDACARLDETLSRLPVTLVAVERFTFQATSAKKTRQYDAIEFIGVARYLCARRGVRLLIQGASDAGKFGTRENLLRLGWWTTGVDHPNRAAAQVALALATTNPRLFTSLL